MVQFRAWAGLRTTTDIHTSNEEQTLLQAPFKELERAAVEADRDRIDPKPLRTMRADNIASKGCLTVDLSHMRTVVWSHEVGQR